MKKNTLNFKKIAVAACLSTVMVTPMAQAANDGWYVGASVGSYDVDDSTFSSNGVVGGVQSPRSVTVDSDSDIGFGGTVGYRFKGNKFGAVRVEGEFQYSKHDVETINFNVAEFQRSDGFVQGDIETTQLFVNVVQEFKGLSKGVRPYVGVGFGLSEFYGDFQYNPTLGAEIDDDDIGLAYQFFIGVDVDLTDRLTGFADYHFIKTDDFDLERTGGGAGGFSSTLQEGDVDLDVFTVGLRYSFK